MKAKWLPKTRRFPLQKRSTIHLDVFETPGSLCRPRAWGINRTHIVAKVTCDICLRIKAEADKAIGPFWEIRDFLWQEVK